MSVPKKRRSKSKVRSARTHKKTSPVSLKKCSSCGEMKQPHRACLNCGKYKDRQAVNLDKRSARSERKRKAGR
jgi:large subunit ribosomal protein L32